MDIMDTAQIAESLPDFAKRHLKSYLATNGRDGHLGFDVLRDGRPPAPPTLILANRGRTSGIWYLTPLTYGADGDRYILIGSRGGSPDHPGWAKNLMAHPDARIQVGEKRMDVVVSVAQGAERDRLWDLMVGVARDYEDYKARTTRELPVFVLTPRARL